MSAPNVPHGHDAPPIDPSLIDAAVDAFLDASRILVFTGAGISTESGIPDFRGPDGLWTRVDPDDFTIQRYLASRALRIRAWRRHADGQLWGQRSGVNPNRAHHAVVRLWESGRMVGCITQNVDGLHRESGLPDEAVSEIHGNVRRAICVGCRATDPIEVVLARVDAGDEDPPCPRCGGILKTATVMFGEMLPEPAIQRAAEFSEAADAVLVIGSTLSVHPAANFALRVRRSGAPMVIINLGETDHDALATVKLEGAAGVTTEHLVGRLL